MNLFEEANGSLECLRGGEGTDEFLMWIVEDMSKEEGGYLMGAVVDNGPASVGFGSSFPDFDMNKAMMINRR